MENNNILNERRRFKRAFYPCRVIIYSQPPHGIDTVTQNIGAGGVRVILEEKLSMLTSVGIELKVIDEPVLLKGRVIWVVSGDKGFDTGIEFFQISEEDRKFMQAFVEGLAA